MPVGKKILWSGLGWVLAGPIGALVGFSLASLKNSSGPYHYSNYDDYEQYPKTRPGDFAISLLVLFGQVMKADNKLLKSELDFIKEFLTKHFGIENSKELMIVFKDILKQDYPLNPICRQIKKEMDHSSRLELIHGLFGLAYADGTLHSHEDILIRKICDYIGISDSDRQSMRAMFLQESINAYIILEIDASAKDQDVKRAYRRMAAKFHPDKVSHLGDDFGKLAEEKFKAVNNAYKIIKKERGIK